MSDLAVPSWRPRPEKQGLSWRMLAMAGGLLGTVAVAGAVTWGLSRMGPRIVPVIEADPRPIKVKPDKGKEGGLVVPNQDQLLLEPPATRREAERRSGAAQLGAAPEMPALELLRQQAAPPAPPSAAPPPQQPAEAPSTLAPSTLAPVPLAPPVAAAPAVPRPVPNGRGQVQLGALVSEEAARAEWDRLVRRVPELAGFQPRIAKLEREGQPALFRLRTGGLVDPAAGKALCEAVKAKGAACVPVGG